MPFLNEGNVKLDKDALLFCFTDGLVDIQNDEGEYFEEEGLKNFIIENKSMNAQAFNEKIIDRVESFKGEKDYVDDIAILTTKIF